MHVIEFVVASHWNEAPWDGQEVLFFFRTVVSNLAAGVLDPSVGTEVQIISSSETAQSQQAIFFGGYQNETMTRYGMKYQS